MKQDIVLITNRQIIKDLLHELRCDINYCATGENDTEILTAYKTLKKIEKLIKH